MNEMNNAIEVKVNEVVADAAVEAVENAGIDIGKILLNAGKALGGAAIVAVAFIGGKRLWDKHQEKKAFEAACSAACEEAPTEADFEADEENA